MASIRNYTHRRRKRNAAADDYLREYDRLMNEANRIHNELETLIYGKRKKHKKYKK